MKFTKKTDYALRIMQILARQPRKELLPMKTMAADYGMSIKFLQSVARGLTHAGLVNSRSGPHGGLGLSREPSRISVLEIIESVEGKINLMDCLDHPHICSSANMCSIMGVLQQAQNALIDTLRTTSLKRMVEKKKDPFNQIPRENFQNPVYHCPVVKVS